MTEHTYDFSAKNAVRESWMRFLPSSFSNQTDIRGLYLPGPENLEFDGYVAKGLMPERLIGVERDDARFRVLKKLASGITAVHGNVMDAVKLVERKRWPRLSFVNLDFEGSYHTYIAEMGSLFRVFPSEAGGELAVTSFAGRDPEALAQAAANISKIYSGLPAALFCGGYERLRKRHEEYVQLVDPRTSGRTHMSRTLGFLWWMAYFCSSVDYEPAGYGKRDEPFQARVNAVLERITARAEALKGKIDDMPQIDPALMGLLRDRKVALWPTEFQQYIYKNRNHSPMQTKFFRFRLCRGEGRTAADLLELAWRLVVAAPIHYYDESGSLHEIKGK